MLSAWDAGKCLGELEDWPAPGPRIAASRLALHLGNPRLASLIQVRTYRAHPDDPEAQYYFVSQIRERRGALSAWEERHAIGTPGSDDLRPVWLYHGQCALLAAELRDFEAAEHHLRKANEVEPNRPWYQVERAYVYEREDRMEAALAASREGMALNPHYQPAISATVHCLLSLGRQNEAVEILEKKCAETQSSLLVGHLISTFVDARRMDEAEALLPRYEEFTPIRGKDAEQWIANKRITFARERSDYHLVLQLVEKIDHRYFEEVPDRIRAFLDADSDDSPSSRLLDVPYVRQHHVTCAPATLSAVSQYWNKPVEHLAVAEQICYDGTPMHSERKWAKENGFYVREFRVDWSSTVALIDRGIPFTLVVSDAVAGHLQAVVGYDKPMGVVFIRDPQTPSLIEANAQALYQAFESVGPRGMAMVPADRAYLLAELELPESELYDHYYEMQLDLDAHDRDAAIVNLREMEKIDPAHRLALTARGTLGAYDDDPPAILQALDTLHDRYPDDPALRLYRLQILRQLSAREYRLSWLHGLVEQGKADPVLIMEYALELSADDRERDHAMWYLRRAHRRRQDDSPIIHAMAELQWAGGQRERAISYYRFAACLSDTRELYSQSYFTACRWTGETETALDFLRSRVALLGSRSGSPAMSLFIALESLERIEDAFAVLEEARERRPDDGALLLLTARKRAQHGYQADAERLLAEAKGRVRRVDWLAAAADQASWRGDRADALVLWREVIEIEPLNLDAHGKIAQLLSESRSRDAALAHLRSACDTFQHHVGLHYLLYAWTDGDPATEREGVLRHIVEVDPADAWAQRELATNLRRQSRFEEAARFADEALALDARTAAGFTIKGSVLESLGRPTEATECYRTAVRSWADAPGAIHGLLDTHGDTLEKRKEVLEFVESELLKQAAVGDGFLSFREVARAVLTPTELLRSLEHAHHMRPDLWQVWSVLSQHQAEMGRLDDALLIAREATERFPRLPRSWFDLSLVHQLRLEPGEQIEALARCRELNPDWPSPTLSLGTVLENQGRREEAVKILESAIARTPLEVLLRGQLADLHHRDGELDRAIDVVTEAVTINPDYDPGWYRMVAWCSERGTSQGPLELVQQMAETRPGEYRPWIRLAEFQAEAGELDAAIRSLDRAIGIDPRTTIGHDLKAHVLTQQRRFREAEAACTPDVFGSSPPFVLQGRAAWVDAQRGDYTAAIERMHELVQANPDYQWGWRQLMEWFAETGKRKQAMEAAERLAWLDPTDMVPQGWLGDMKRQLGDVMGAKRVLRRAMEFQPTYLFAGFEYFDMQRTEGDFEGAERTLKILALHAKEEDVLAARIQIEASKDNRDRALELMRELCRLPDANEDALKRAAAAITKHQWQRNLQRLLKRLMQEPGWHDSVPAIWAGSCADRGRFGSPFRYLRLVRLGEPGKAAICHVLEALGDQGKTINRIENPWKYLRFRWHVRVIRWICHMWWEDDLYWGSVGYALVCLSRYRSMIRWMSSWQSRSNVQSWMLQNLAIALLTKRKDRQAREVLRFVSGDLTHSEPVAPSLRVWCALGAILDEDWDLAGQMLHQAPADVLEDRQKQLRKFASVALGALTSTGHLEPLSLGAENTIQKTVTEYAGVGAQSRLINLVRYKVGRHTRRTWIAFGAWRKLYPERLAALVLAGAAALISLWLLTGPH